MDGEYSPAPKDEMWLSIQTESVLSPDIIREQLLTLATAFPTAVKNYDQHEYQAMKKLWYNIFQNVPEKLLQEAVKRFIINNQKGFFPSPGQIVGYIEQIVEERRKAEQTEALIKHQKEVHEYIRLVKKGENCANCEFCRQEERDCFGNERMFCTNRKSPNYEDRRKAGVASSLRCELFSVTKN